MCGVWRAKSISSNSNAPRGNIGSIKLEFKSYPFKTNTMGTGLLKGCLQITPLSDDALFIVTQIHKGRVGFNFKVPYSIDSSERKKKGNPRERSWERGSKGNATKRKLNLYLSFCVRTKDNMNQQKQQQSIVLALSLIHI